MFTSEFNTIKCIEGEILQFKCSMYSEDINVELSKVDAKDKQIGNISMQVDGKDHCMTIQQAQLSDAGQYMMSAGNVHKQVTVAVEEETEFIEQSKRRHKNDMPTNISNEQSNTSSVIASKDEVKHNETEAKSRNDISDTTTLSDLETSKLIRKVLDDENNYSGVMSLRQKNVNDNFVCEHGFNGL
ncbi:TTN [Mytilus edulis]|uniref:TTN n=1 Tax=Mytilus edulis TaxID=6550 RepID=A0A8S3TSX3_MYTED|nr:TTN [Mytilus edulis]